MAILLRIAGADPCKRWQNGADEGFNGGLRDVWLSLEWFRFHPTRVVIESGRRHDNAVRPPAARPD